MPTIHARFGMYFMSEKEFNTAEKAFIKSLSIRENARQIRIGQAL